MQVKLISKPTRAILELRYKRKLAVFDWSDLANLFSMWIPFNRCSHTFCPLRTPLLLPRFAFSFTKMPSLSLDFALEIEKRVQGVVLSLYCTQSPSPLTFCVSVCLSSQQTQFISVEIFSYFIYIAQLGNNVNGSWKSYFEVNCATSTCQNIRIRIENHICNVVQILNSNVCTELAVRGFNLSVWEIRTRVKRRCIDIAVEWLMKFDAHCMQPFNMYVAKYFCTQICNSIGSRCCFFPSLSLD